ncbi:hypothetical protein [Mycoplasma miroungirhinis]|uniref:Uncharacterized protein n=1 Tax=Mycoplasma miroungirhinis TaxID=754516 RepID=A0A6M4JB74_9MOLU|nr:hypothetical protein [Mycoplasma miroungirhinis]QJR44170.1 hypothetical protein HLA92_01850 [Mycoplasma miroungirhinis]
MSETNKNKRKRFMLATLLTTAIPAVALAITVPLLHTNLDADDLSKEINAYRQLNEVTNKAIKFLKSQNELSKESVEQLQNEINYSKQISQVRLNRNNTDLRSSITNMLNQRNKIRSLMLRLTYKDSKNKETLDKTIDEYKNLIRAKDLQAEFKSLLSQNKSKEEFLTEVDKIVEHQDQVNFSVELEMNIFQQGNITKLNRLHLGSKINELNDITKFIYERLEKGEITRDAVNVYENMFDNESKKLFNNEINNNTQSINKLLSQIDEAKRQVSLAAFEDDQKAKIDNELDAVKDFINLNQIDLNATVIDADGAKTAFDLISNFVSSITTKSAQYFKSQSEVVALVKSLILNTKKSINNYQNTFSNKINSVLENAQNYIDNKKYDNVQEIYSNLFRDLNSINIASKLTASVQTLIENSQLNNQEKSEMINEIKNMSYTDFFSYVSKLNGQIAHVNAAQTIKDFLKENLQTLKSQIEFSIANAGFYSTTNDLNEINQTLNAINILDTNNISNSDLATQFEMLLNVERKHNKKELANLLPQLHFEFSKNTVSKDLKQIWDSKKDTFQAYTHAFSTASRLELASTTTNLDDNFNQGATQYSYNLLNDAKLSNRVNSLHNETDKTLELINEEFWDDNDNPVKLELETKVKEIASQALVIEQNNSLSTNQKHALLEKLEKEHDIYRNKISEIRSLGAERDEAIKILDSVKNNEKVKIYLAKELKLIKDLKEKADQALNNPTSPNFNLSEIQAELNAALKDFGDKKNELEGATAASAIKRLLNDVFSSQRDAAQTETPAESKLSEALKKLQDESVDIGTSDKSELEKTNARQVLSNKFAILRDAIEATSDLEIGTKNLEADHQRALRATAELKEEANGDIFPDEESQNEFKDEVSKLETKNAQTQAKIDELHNIINSVLYDPNIHNKAWLEQKNREINNLRKQIEINVAAAKLKREQLLLSLNKINVNDLQNADDINQQPYSILVADVERFETEKQQAISNIETKNAEIQNLNQQIADKQAKLEELWKNGINLIDEQEIKENDKKIATLQSEVNNLQQKVVDAYNSANFTANNTAVQLAQKQPLLEKLKEAALTLNKLDKTKYPELAQNLLKVINENRASSLDNNGTINNKIANINAMLQKSESSKQSKDELEKLKDLQKDQFKNDNYVQRKIFEDVDNQITELFNQQKAIIEDPNSTNSQLIQAKNVIKNAIVSFKNKKTQINQEFEQAKDDLANEIERLEKIEINEHFQSHNPQDPTHGSYIQKLKKQYQDLINNTATNVTSQTSFDQATLADFQNIRSQLNLAFNKDKFNDKKAKLLQKVQASKEKLAQAPQLDLNGENPIEKIEQLINKLNENVNDENSTNNVNDIIRQDQKLDSLDILLDEQDKVIKKAKTLNNNDVNKQFLIDAFKQSSPTAHDVNPTATDPTNETINNKIAELSAKFAEAASFDEVKADQKADIAKTKELFDAKIVGSDDKAKTAIDQLLDQYTQDVEQVQRSDNDHQGDDKKQVIAIGNKAKKIRANIQNIVDFANLIKKSNETQSQITPSGVLENALQELKKKIADKLADAQTKYTDIDSFNVLSQEINTLVKSSKELVDLNTNLTTLKTQVESITYRIGTHNDNDPATKKQEFQNYVTKLIEYANSDTVKNDSIQISLLNTIAKKAQALANHQTETLKNYDKTAWNYENTQYGFTYDEKNIGQAVLDAVPKIPAGNFNSIELTQDLETKESKLNSDYDDADKLYEKRKEALEQTKETLTNSISQIDSFTNANGKYDELKKDQKIFFVSQLDKIKNVQSPANIENITTILNETSSTNQLLPLYVSLADTVSLAKIKVAEVNAINETKAEILTNTTNEIQSKYEEIEKTSATTVTDNYYYKELNKQNINQKITELKSLIAKVDLLKQYNTKLNLINNEIIDNDTNKNDKLKQPLKEILNSLINELNGIPVVDVDIINTLVNKYLTVGNNSFDVALEHTKQLYKAINLAKSFQPNKSESYYQNETQAMKDLYDKLDKVILTAQTNIEEVFASPKVHNEANKLLSIYNINDNIDGIIALIKNQKQREIQSVLSEITDLDKYLTQNYNSRDPHKTPRSNEYLALKIRQSAYPNLDTFEKIKTAQDNYTNALKGLKTQKQGIINFETNRLKVIYDQLNPYVKFLKGLEYKTSTMLSDSEAKKISSYLGFEDASLDNFGEDLKQYTTITANTDNNQNFILRTNELRNLYNSLENDYKNIKNISKNSYIQLKNEITLFNQQLKEDNNNHQNLYDLVKIIADKNSAFDALKTKISEVNDKTIAINTNNDLLSEQSYDIDYNQTNNSKETEINQEFNNFETATKSILAAIDSIDKLIYDTNNNSIDSLQSNYNKFIEKRTLDKMLELIADTNHQQNNNQNTIFGDVINTYTSIYNSLVNANKNPTNTELAKKNALSITQKLDILKNIYNSTVSLYKWINDPVNKQFFFNYLVSNNQEHIRNEISPKDNVLLEDLKEEIKKQDSQNTLIQIDVTNNTQFLDFFDKFLFLKGNETIFNTNNVHVYITRNSTSEDWIPAFLQSDTSIKKTKFNIKIEYTKPTSGDNFFNDVTNFDIRFNDIFVTFNTLQALRFTKADLYDPNHPNNNASQNQTYSNNKVLFNASKAGWNNKTFTIELLSKFSAGGAQYQQENGLSLIREDISFDGDRYEQSILNQIPQPENVNTLGEKAIFEGNYDNMDLSTSSANLKYKIKFKNDIPGLNIPLNGSTTKYWKIPKIKNKQFMYWTQNSSDLRLDGGNYRSWIPFFISIPVVSDDGQYGVLYRWYQSITTIRISSTDDYQYKYAEANDRQPGWYLYLPNESDKNKIDMSDELTDINDDATKNAIKANLWAKAFGNVWKDKLNAAYTTYTNRYFAVENYDEKFNQVLDKYDIYLKLHNKKEGSK